MTLSKDQFVSLSKLKSDAECPKRQHFEPYQETIQKNYGDAVHFALAQFYRDMRDGKDTTGVFQRWFRERGAKLKLTPEEMQRGDRAFQRVMDALPRLGINPDSILSIESEDGTRVYDFRDKGGDRKVFFEVEVVPGVWGIRGAMDLVVTTEDGGIRIPDWKTGHGEETDDLQSAGYALVGSLMYPGFAYYETGYFYTESGKWVSTRWDRTSLVGAFETIDKAARTFLGRKEWPAKLNRNCAYCTLRSTCDEHQKAITQKPAKAEWELDPTVENFPAIHERFLKIDAMRKAVMGVYETLKGAREECLRKFGEKIIVTPKTGEPKTRHRLRVGDRDVTGSEKPATYDYDVGRIFDEVGALIGRPPFEVLDFKSGAFDDLVASFGAKDQKSLRDALRAIKRKYSTLKSSSFSVVVSIAKGAPPEVEQGPSDVDDATIVSEDPAGLAPAQDNANPTEATTKEQPPQGSRPEETKPEGMQPEETQPQNPPSQTPPVQGGASISLESAPPAPVPPSGQSHSEGMSASDVGKSSVPASDSVPPSAVTPPTGLSASVVTASGSGSELSAGSAAGSTTQGQMQRWAKGEPNCAPYNPTWYVCVKCRVIEESTSRIERCRHCNPPGALVACSSPEMARVASGLKKNGQLPAGAQPVLQAPPAEPKTEGETVL